jgi:DnaK suppressor protein
MVKKNFKNIVLPPKYIPKKTEPYMCPEHLAYFYQLLTARREQLADDHKDILNDVRIADKTENAGVGDEQDQTTFEQEIAMDLRMSERNANLLKKIDAALERIENGTFGYSVISGDEIGLQRLLARPLATKTIEEQEEIEKNEK